MRSTPLKKPLVAVATVLAVLGIMASPASADTGTLTGAGSMKIHTAGNVANPVYDIPLPNDGTGPQCSTPLPAGSIDMSFSGNATSGTWTASTPSGPVKTLMGVVVGWNVFQVDLSIVTASGGYTTTGAPAGYTHALSSTAPNHVILQAKFYRQSGSSPFDCTKSALSCTLNMRVVLRPGGGFNGSLPGAGTGETAKLLATSDFSGGLALTPFGSCDADVSSLNGKHVTFELFLTF